MFDADELQDRFVWHSVGEEQVLAHQAVRDRCLSMALWLNATVPDGREKALALTHLEDVMFWSNAAIARSGGPQ